jgi:hypothetical protein
MNYTKVAIATLIKNAVAIICWAALAAYFGKWWIALFAVVFYTSIGWRSDGDSE